MLLMSAFVSLLTLWDKRLLDNLPQDLLRDRIPMVLTQVLNRILITQEPAGFWQSENSLEHTAYSILTLKNVESLPWLAPLRRAITSAIQKGQEFLILSKQSWTDPQFLWIEKVSYGLPSLSEVYCLAAVHSFDHAQFWSGRVCDLIEVPQKALLHLTRFFSTLDMFHNVPQWKIQASLLEGLLFLPQLESAKLDILPRQSHAKNEYLKSIPCTWTMIKNHYRFFLPPSLLWDMMVLTLCNFRADEYMEDLTAHRGAANSPQIKRQIFSLFAMDRRNGSGVIARQTENATGCLGRSRNNNKRKRCSPDESSPDEDQADDVLKGYTRAMLAHPRISQASLSGRARFQDELLTFLLSHVDQAVDNETFPLERETTLGVRGDLGSSRESFYSWVHGTGANSVSCPMSFAFFTCLLASLFPSSADYFASTYDKYLAHDLCSRLAVMSRLYNDFGSIARDRAERTINSINFPEFSTGEETKATTASHDEELKRGKKLLALAEYERENANCILEKLSVSLEAGGDKDRAKAKGLQLFAKVTALYADMYVAKDLSNRKDDCSGRSATQKVVQPPSSLLD